jgi:PAS domain-containing protein
LNSRYFWRWHAPLLRGFAGGHHGTMDIKVSRRAFRGVNSKRPSESCKPKSRIASRQKRPLRQSEERTRLMVEGVKDYAILMLDLKGRVTTWNAGTERIKGYMRVFAARSPPSHIRMSISR